MQSSYNLKFIREEELIKYVKIVLDAIGNANKMAEKDLFRNVIDPFSALFDASSQGIKLKEWLEQERARKIQKSFQNAIGSFHENIIGSIKGWEVLDVGNVFDVKNDKIKIIAEIKNKYNTTKGNHKVAIYDDLNGQLKNKYKGYTSYYVEIIPNGKKKYNNFFTPPDNNKGGKRRTRNEKIRIIDGYSFYALATGDKDALRKLYKTLPIILTKLIKKSVLKIRREELFKELFDRVY